MPKSNPSNTPITKLTHSFFQHFYFFVRSFPSVSSLFHLSFLHPHLNQHPRLQLLNGVDPFLYHNSGATISSSSILLKGSPSTPTGQHEASDSGPGASTASNKINNNNKNTDEEDEISSLSSFLSTSPDEAEMQMMREFRNAMREMERMQEKFSSMGAGPDRDEIERMWKQMSAEMERMRSEMAKQQKPNNNQFNSFNFQIPQRPSLWDRIRSHLTPGESSNNSLEGRPNKGDVDLDSHTDLFGRENTPGGPGSSSSSIRFVERRRSRIPRADGTIEERDCLRRSLSEPLECRVRIFDANGRLLEDRLERTPASSPQLPGPGSEFFPVPFPNLMPSPLARPTPNQASRQQNGPEAEPAPTKPRPRHDDERQEPLELDEKTKQLYDKVFGTRK